ncbi:hypothetical protein ACQJBY_016009 [Aegilops geniculata]
MRDLPRLRRTAHTHPGAFPEKNPEARSRFGVFRQKRSEREERGDGGLGPGDRRDGAVRAADAGAAVHAAGARAGGGVRQHAHQRPLHPHPRRPLLRARHHLPHRRRRPRLHRLAGRARRQHRSVRAPPLDLV